MSDSHTVLVQRRTPRAGRRAASDDAGTLTRSLRGREARLPLRRRIRNRLNRPGSVLLLAFAGACAVFTVLLLLPVATAPGQDTSFLISLFTSTGAVSGALPVVDTSSHWSGFGEVVILLGMQVGGLGFMTAASLLGLLVFRRLGLRTRLVAAAETQSVDVGDVRRIIRSVGLIAFGVELLAAAALWPRLWLGYGQTPARAAYDAVFLSVSGFNNAGLALYPDNLIRFVDDPLVIVPLGVAALIGALGLPVLLELRRELLTPRLWSLHTKITVFGFVVLTVGGTFAIAVFEWSNSATLRDVSSPGKLLAGFFGSIVSRAGFNSIDYGAADSTTLLTTDVLMFIGGGSASTAGGIKVTTFLVLFFAILAEIRGHENVTAFGRQLPVTVLRQAVAVALLGVAVVVVGTLVLLAISDHELEPVLFEVISAFGTVGLSTGITGDLPAAGQYVLILLMFIGRTGPISFAATLALRERPRLYRLPEERPIVG